MKETAGDVVTIEDLSSYLKTQKSTLYRSVAEGNVPYNTIGHHSRFRKEAIDRWFEETHGDTKDGGND